MSLDELIRILERAEQVAVFTGAGVSTLSGIRDFRGKDGIYKEFDADKIFSLREFLRDPSYYYRMTRNFIYNLDEKTPSLVHLELANLEARGLVSGVITQNIDLLHQKAGSVNVIELHGTPSIHYCLGCGMEYPFSWVAEIVQEERVPHCQHCGGNVKPAITFFGEMLPEGALERAIALAAKADVMLVLGSSLVVQPAASIPLHTANAGGKLIIVNEGATPLDSYATLRYNDLESVFHRIAEAFA